MKTLFFSFLLIIQSSFAQDCNELNLITAPDSPFKEIPIYDQDGIGICYAYAASQIADYEIIKAGGKRSIHPLWAALKFSEDKKQKNITGGLSVRALRSILEQGNCSTETVSKALAKWAEKANASEAEVMALVEKVAAKLERTLKSKTASGDTLGICNEEIETAIKGTINVHKLFCSPGANFDPLLPDLVEMSDLSSVKMFRELLKNECQDNISKVSLPTPKNFAPGNEAEYIPAIQQKLESLQSPVSIAYCSKVLYKPDYDGIQRRVDITKNDKHSSDCGPHESILVGKKMIGNSCHFLLRNTWGTGFSDATKNWKCLCKNRETGEMLDNCNNKNHNNGKYTVEACWIDSEALSKNIQIVTTLEPESK